MVIYPFLFVVFFFFFNDTAPSEIYTLSLHDALPISVRLAETLSLGRRCLTSSYTRVASSVAPRAARASPSTLDRKSTRLNSSHLGISYAVFCLKKKTKRTHTMQPHVT